MKALQGTVPDEALQDRDARRGQGRPADAPLRKRKGQTLVSVEEEHLGRYTEIRDNQVKLIIAVLNCFLVEKPIDLCV